MSKNQRKSSNNSLNPYARYTGMAFQMIAIIGLFTWIGVKIDGYTDRQPLFTIILVLVGVVLAMAFFIKDFLQK